MVQIKRDNMPVTCRDMQGHAERCQGIQNIPTSLADFCRHFPDLFFLYTPGTKNRHSVTRTLVGTYLMI